MRHIQTKFAFTKMLCSLNVDLILDVGSRDAQESLIFKAACPGVRVIALEANPFNAAKIRSNAAVIALGIELQEVAAWKEAGTVSFHVTKVDYDDPRANTGTSSIKPHLLLNQERIEVPAVSLTELIRRDAPNAKRIALWIYVEGAEAEVIEGLTGVMDKVVMIHVETATEAMHAGQRLLSDLDHMLAGAGMAQVGWHMEGGHWGDVLYVNRSIPTRSYGRQVTIAKALARFPRRKLATALWTHAPRLHATLKRLFGRNLVLSGF